MTAAQAGAPSGRLAGIARHRALPALLLAFFGYFILWASLYWAGIVPGAEGSIVDFHAFYLAGQMYWDGSIADAYYFDKMHAAQIAYTGTDNFMPWAYPPPFDLLVVPLALLPLGVSFFVFTALTFAGFVLVLRRFSGPCLGPVLLAIAPAIFVNVFTGQNGFLTAMLLGLAVALALQGRTVAGLPLGLMVIKPHLALGLGVTLLVRRQWRIIAVAAAVVVASVLVATLVLGHEIWPAFLHGAERSGVYLERGNFPLYRMTSAYATLRTLGAGPGGAFLAQVAVALVAVGIIGAVAWKVRDARLTAGVALLGGTLISPYGYDYDLTALGLGLAVLAPYLAGRAGWADALGLMALSWIGTGAGLVTILIFDTSGGGTDVASGLEIRSFTAFACIALVIWVGLILRRPARG